MRHFFFISPTFNPAERCWRHQIYEQNICKYLQVLSMVMRMKKTTLNSLDASIPLVSTLVYIVQRLQTRCKGQIVLRRNTLWMSHQHQHLGSKTFEGSFSRLCHVVRENWGGTQMPFWTKRALLGKETKSLSKARHGKEKQKQQQGIETDALRKAMKLQGPRETRSISTRGHQAF